jgi:phytol kinase
MVRALVNPWQGMAVVLGVFGGLLILLRWYQRRFKPHAETTRKLFHVGMGLFTLALPLLFESYVPVFALTLVTLALMLLMRRAKGGVGGLNEVMGGVGRYSLGEVYFPLSVALLFYLSRDNLVLYTIPILILTLADSTAALIGVRYGRMRYEGVGGMKSWEGSVAFFVVTFFSVHVPLLLFTDVGRAESLLIAAILGVLVMLFEAIAWDGLDNFFIPLAAYVLLRFYTVMSAGQLVRRLLFTLALGVFVYAYRDRTTLNSNGLLGAVVVGYVCWWLGGRQWIVPPLVLFVAYTLFAPRTASNSQRIHNFHAVISICGAGLVWLLIYRATGQASLFLPYVTAFGGHLAIAGVARLKCDYPQMTATAVLTSCISKGWLLMFVAYVLLEGVGRSVWAAGILTLGGVAAAALIFYAIQPQMDDCPTDAARWWRQSFAGMVGSAVAALPLIFPSGFTYALNQSLQH